MKKLMKVVPILFLIFGIFQIAHAIDVEAARTDLQNSLATLAMANKTPQLTVYGKRLQQGVQAFLKKGIVIDRRFDAPEFKSDLSDLVAVIDPNETSGVLSKAVQDVESKFDSYQAATAYSGNGAGENRNSLDSNSNASDTRGGGGTRNQKNADKSGPNIDQNEWGIYDYAAAGAMALIVITGLGLLLFIAMKAVSLQRTTDEYFGGALPRALSGVKARQDDLAKQIDASAGVSKDINQRLAGVHTELRLMSRMLQQANLANNRTANSPPMYSEASAPQSDAPVFPIAADELLRQMQNKSVVVKRDFQNDMLVSDPDGKGELVLIRDSHLADEIQPLFIVPRVTQFQMRQEYYNFYEKYYECANPESGAVWILDPAVVEKVVGGWELREKGRLEVR